MTGPRRRRAAEAIETTLRRTRAVILLERLTRAFWPLGSLLLAGWALAAFGLADRLAPVELTLALAVFAAFALWLLYRGIRAFRWPRRAEALARVDATLPGQPLAALEDRQAIGRDDGGAAAVWAAHLARMRAAAAGARAPAADLRLAARDPWAFRLMALVLFVAALVFARGDGVGTLGQALVPAGGAAAPQGPSFDAWAEPPAYTGRPTLYLPEVPGDRPVELPQGTEITFRAYGPADGFDLSENVSSTEGTALATAAEGIATAAFPVERTGSVALRQGERPLGEWSFLMRPDEAPAIELAEPVGRAVTGAMQLAYSATDDYGVTAARAEVSLDLDRVPRAYGLAADPAPREPLVIDLPLPVTGDPAAIAETLVEDFSQHPWVGLPVRVTLIATDAIGQEGRQVGSEAVLPGRRFFDPIAAALVEQRRDLFWSPENLRRVTQVLRAVTWQPEGVWDSPRAYLLTRTAIRRIEGGEAEAIPEAAELLWQAALLIEEGGLGDAAERLAEAQERLSEALQNDATDEEIAQLMDELREATREYMEQLAQEAIERGETQQAENGGQPPGEEMSPDQIQELMDRIQELSEQGRRAEAEQLLEMLRQMLENMEMRLAEGGEGQGQQGQGQQALEDLADALRGQQDLADDSFGELQRQFQQNRQGQPGQQGQQGQQGQPGQPGQPGGEPGQSPGEEGSLSERQEALREMIEDLQNGLPGSQNEAGEAARQALREAEREMGEARDRLGEGSTAEALDNQAEAIDQLREGMRSMADEMRQAEGGSPEGQGEATAEGDSEGRADPLGRPTGSRGNVGTDENMVPEADARARARVLLDEIRRRAGEQARPDLELDYLRRLLDRF